jgi:hypothetical protein
MTCLPAERADACAGVASTVDQSERHVFPGCARDTCHNASQSDHTLTLLPGQAYLVGGAGQPGRAKRRQFTGMAQSFLLANCATSPSAMSRATFEVPRRRYGWSAWIEAGRRGSWRQGFQPGASALAIFRRRLGV